MRRRLDPDLRKALLRRAAGRCENCGEALVWHSTHVHHLTYERVGCERPDDLLVLCLRCHERQHPGREFHSLLEQERRRQRKKRKGKGGHRRGGVLSAQEQARRSLDKAKRRFERPCPKSFEDIARSVQARLEKERRRSDVLRWLGARHPDRDGQNQP